MINDRGGSRKRDTNQKYDPEILKRGAQVKKKKKKNNLQIKIKILQAHPLKPPLDDDIDGSVQD